MKPSTSWNYTCKRIHSVHKKAKIGYGLGKPYQGKGIADREY
jgi:RimJ/RimL family protein N-acetyltransferase